MQKEQLLRDTLVKLNSSKTHRQVSYWDIFVLSYSKMNMRGYARRYFDNWLSGLRLPVEVEDFCLDILTLRLEVKLRPRKASKRK